MPAARLLVTGPPGAHNPANAAYFDELRRLRDALGLGGQVHFLAEASNRARSDAVISDCYRLADALLLPSFEEGFGIPLLEAAISHLPIFCTAVAPLPELGAADVTYFAPDEDPGHVAAAIAARLGASAAYRFAVRARQAYTWPQVYADHIAPLLAALAAAPADNKEDADATTA
jgi:glycosyltransferase involved in cell wall biosynthesis